MTPPGGLIPPAATPTTRSDATLSDSQVLAWRERGAVLADGVWPPGLMSDAIAAAHRVCPPTDEQGGGWGLTSELVFPFCAKAPGQQDPGGRGGSVSRANLATMSLFDEITLHPRLLRAASQLLGCEPNELRLTQSEIWPKRSAHDTLTRPRECLRQRRPADPL